MIQNLSGTLNNRKVAPFVFLAPFLIFFIGFKVWPMLYALILSFREIEGVGSGTWTGLSNYQRLFSDARFVKSLFNTSYYTVGTLVLLISLPLILAQLLYSNTTARSGLFRTLLFLPILTSVVVAGTVFQLILAPEGMFNRGLGLLGFEPRRWLEVAELAVPSMIIMATWRWTGMNIIYFTAGLTNIPSEIFEAASIDGADAFRRFFYITLPMLKPVIVFVMALTLIGGFQVFAEPYILWAGNTPGEGGLTMVLYLYRTAFRSFNLGYASTIGVALAAIILVFSLIQFRLLGFFAEE